MQVTDSVGSISGFVSHLGGSVCPEHSSSNWDVTVTNKDTGAEEWIHDASLAVTCDQPLEAGGSREAGGHTAGDRAAEARGSEAERLAAMRRSDGSAAIIGLAVLCLIMFSVFVAIFGAKFRRAWSQGAQGGQLIRESFRIN